MQRKTLIKSEMGVRLERIEDLAAQQRAATRYDRCPTVFLSAIALAAVVLFWL